MDLLMEASWTGHGSYERSVGVMRPVPQMDFQLPVHVMQELTDSFAFFDRNGDGHISQAELAAVLRALGTQEVTEADVENLVRDVDVNGDGHLDLYEFIELNTRAMKVKQFKLADEEDDGTVSAFRVFDEDRNGFISPEELHRVWVGLGADGISVDDCRRLIQSVDEDGDQMVDFREFQALITASPGTTTCVH